MARHAQLCIDTGLAIYFCDPHSPWQRDAMPMRAALASRHPRDAEARPRSYGRRTLVSRRVRRGEDAALTGDAKSEAPATTGQLEELPEDPIGYFAKLGLHGPWNLQIPERLQ
jgi:hypothetical protein